MVQMNYFLVFLVMAQTPSQDKLIGDRFSSLRDLLGDAFIAVELPTRHKKDHSTLTEQRDDASVERVIRFLTEKLQ